ncbi:MAG: tetratricopeptide repeat protein [Burkholderiaceae bacterium]
MNRLRGPQVAFCLFCWTGIAGAADALHGGRLPVAGAMPPHLEPPPSTSIALDRSPASAQAIALYRNRDFAQARDAVRAVVEAHADDVVARFVYGAALKQTGDCEEARRQLSLVIAWNPAMTQLFTTRATCAARMGNEMRARADLAIAKALDRDDRAGLRQAAEREVDEALRDLPTEPVDALQRRLLDQAGARVPFEELTKTAQALLKASNRARLVGDETYSERRRRLSWWLAEAPADPDRLARFGRMLLDERTVDSHWIESPNDLTAYRLQGPRIAQIEQDRAREYFEAALRSNPNHVLALAGLARIAYERARYGDAEQHLRRAMAAGEPDAEVLYLMRNVLARAAGQNIARSMALTKVSRWTERYGGTVYEYTRSPTAAGLARASEHDAQASRLLALSTQYRHRVLEQRPDDPRTHDYIGTLAYEMKDWAAAEHAYRRAIALDPDNVDYQTALANVFARQGDVARYLEQASRARNLVHTNAGTHLHWAWGRIARRDWDGARQVLSQAMAIDPGDPLPYAYRGVIAESLGDAPTALAEYRAAVAMEEAHAHQHGASYVNDRGRWLVARIARVVELRMRIALLSEAGDPAYALRLYQANLQLESSLTDAALREKCARASFPAPGTDADLRPREPLFGELMRTNRALLAYRLYAAGRFGDALAHFKALRDYDRRMKAGGAKGFEYLKDTVWQSQPVVAAALDTFERVGERGELAWWARKARGPFDAAADWRRNVPQMPPRPMGLGGGKG